MDQAKMDPREAAKEEQQQVEFIARDLYEHFHHVFRVYEVGYSRGSFFFYGMPLADRKTMEETLSKLFASRAFDLDIRRELGEDVVVATPIVIEPFKKDRVWINIILAIATVLTTMSAGAGMFGVDIVSNPAGIVQGLPFTLAIMAVLGFHEMGHYMAARVHGMHTSLPYFIPFPSLIGTMGAVIRHKGRIPDRKVLFDVAVAGPVVGLVMSVIVTAIGLSLDPVAMSVSDTSIMVDLELPFLFDLLVDIFGQTGEMMHPVAFAGWVGMLVTVLNLLPSGQLDGGHMMRAMIGERSKQVSSFMPLLLAGLALYIIVVLGKSGGIWILWSLLLLLFARAGHPSPANDSEKLDRGRMALGVVTFILGIMCFTLVPFTIVM